jgi:hypothetical protein
MNGKFTLEIKLGNDAMMTPGAVARTLENVAGILWRTRAPEAGKAEDGAIVDDNGNRVGSWELVAEPARKGGRS